PTRARVRRLRAHRRRAHHLAPAVARRTLPRRPPRARARVPRPRHRRPGGPRVTDALIVEVAHGPQRGAKAVIEPGDALVIGTAPDVDWILADSPLAPRQFEIGWDGRVGTVHHRGGAVTTWLDGQVFTRAAVGHGAWIRAGATDFTAFHERHTPP